MYTRFSRLWELGSTHSTRFRKTTCRIQIIVAVAYNMNFGDPTVTHMKKKKLYSFGLCNWLKSLLGFTLWMETEELLSYQFVVLVFFLWNNLQGGWFPRILLHIAFNVTQVFSLTLSGDVHHLDSCCAFMQCREKNQTTYFRHLWVQVHVDWC